MDSRQWRTYRNGWLDIASVDRVTFDTNEGALTATLHLRGGRAVALSSAEWETVADALGLPVKAPGNDGPLMREPVWSEPEPAPAPEPEPSQAKRPARGKTKTQEANHG